MQLQLCSLHFSQFLFNWIFSTPHWTLLCLMNFLKWNFDHFVVIADNLFYPAVNNRLIFSWYVFVNLIFSDFSPYKHTMCLCSYLLIIFYNLSCSIIDQYDSDCLYWLFNCLRIILIQKILFFIEILLCFVVLYFTVCFLQLFIKFILIFFFMFDCTFLTDLLFDLLFMLFLVMLMVKNDQTLAKLLPLCQTIWNFIFFSVFEWLSQRFLFFDRAYYSSFVQFW